MHETLDRRDTSGLHRGGYYGNERRSLRDGFHHMRGQSLDDGYYRDRTTFAQEDRPGTSGRISDRDAFNAEAETPQKRQTSERKSERRRKSRGHGGKKHKEKV